MADAKLIAGHFERLEIIGEGAMGTVYKGRDTQNGELVAIKALKPDVIKQDPQIIERFEREGEALRRLNHPSIVKVIATAIDEKNHYLILEYVEGGSLRDLMDKTPQLPINDVLEIALDLSDALARAHRLDIVHRDIKPANVLIAPDGTPRLTDFGIAHIGDTSQMTQTGVIMGTLAYLPPEALGGQKTDYRGDIWAFGVMLYEMCTGRRPFDGDNTGAILNGILNTEPPDMLQFRAYEDFKSWGLPGLIYWLLEKEREKRPQSARLIGAMVENLMSGTELPSLNWFGDTTGQYDDTGSVTIAPKAAARAVREYTTSGFSLSELNAQLEQAQSTDSTSQTASIGLDSQWTADPTISRSDWSVNMKRKIDHQPRIFISYRRADSTSITGRIHDRLAMAFGEENIFKDVMDIPAGADYKDVIEHQILAADVVLVMIGDKWLNAANENGRRLEDPADVVRFEIVTGLQNKHTLVIPVLVNNARMPEKRLLPPDMQALAHYNAARVRNDPDFNRDAEWLINQTFNAFEIEGSGRSLSSRPMIAIAALVLVTIVALVLLSGAGGFDSILNPATETPEAIATVIASSVPDPTPLVPTACNVEAVLEGEFMILVANAEHISGDERDVQRFIIDDLTEHFEVAIPNSRYRIRGSETIIRNDENARQLADLCDALVIVWGNYDDNIIEMNVHLGDLSAYPSESVFSEDDLRIMSDARYRMTNERQETLAFGVVATFNMAWTATNISYNVGESLTIAEIITDPPAEVIGNTTGARYHNYIANYINNTAESITFLDDAIRTNGGNSLLYISRALGYMRLGELGNARDDVLSARILAPDNWVSPDFMTASDFVYYQLDLEGALPHVTAAIEIEPDDWFIRSFRGTIHYLLQDFEVARPDIEQSLVNDPRANFPYMPAAAIALRDADFVTALSILDEVQTKFPDPRFTERIILVIFSEEATQTPIVPLVSAFGNLTLGRWNAMITNTDEVIASGFEHPDTYFLRGFAQCNLEDYEAAEESFSRAIELDPDYYYLYLLRAESLARQTPPRLLDALADIRIVIESPQSDRFAPFTSRGIGVIDEAGCKNLMELDLVEFGITAESSDE